MQVKRTSQSSRKRIGQDQRRGFTLIELLVVVAIIALLISILLPSLNRARQQARTVVCGTQLKQYATGFELYFMDNDDKLFPYTSRGLGYRLLRKHLEKVDQLMMCPSTRKLTDSEKDALQWHGAGYTSRDAWCWAAPGTPATGPIEAIPDPELYLDGSYTFNGWLFDPSDPTFNGIAYGTRAPAEALDPPHPYHFKRLSAIKTASIVPLMMDGFEQLIYAVNEAGGRGGGALAFDWNESIVTLEDLRRPRESLREDNSRSVFTSPFSRQLYRAMPDRHPNFQNNMVFMDGHVEKLSPPQLLDLDWGPKFTRGNVNRREIEWPSFR